MVLQHTLQTKVGFTQIHKHMPHFSDFYFPDLLKTMLPFPCTNRLYFVLVFHIKLSIKGTVKMAIIVCVQCVCVKRSVSLFARNIWKTAIANWSQELPKLAANRWDDSEGERLIRLVFLSFLEQKPMWTDQKKRQLIQTIFSQEKLIREQLWSNGVEFSPTISLYSDGKQLGLVLSDVILKMKCS